MIDALEICDKATEAWRNAAALNRELASAPSPFSLFFTGCAAICDAAVETSSAVAFNAWVLQRKRG